MNEHHKPDPASPWMPVVIILAIICAGTQLSVIIRQMEIFHLIIEDVDVWFPFFRMVALRVTGLVAAVAVLIGTLINKHFIAVAVLIGYYVVSAALYLFNLFLPGIIIVSVLYFVFHLITALILGLMLAKQVPVTAAFTSCLILQIMWIAVYFYLNRASVNWLSLLGTVAPAAMLLSLLCLINEKPDKIPADL